MKSEAFCNKHEKHIFYTPPPHSLWAYFQDFCRTDDFTNNCLGYKNNCLKAEFKFDFFSDGSSKMKNDRCKKQSYLQSYHTCSQ